MEVVALLVESMKALQRQISEGHDSQGTIKGVEVVRQVAKLPALGSIQGNTSQGLEPNSLSLLAFFGRIPAF